MNGYLLDTCVVSDFIKGDSATINHLKSHHPSDIYISSITYMEIEYGLQQNPDKAKKISGLLRDFLQSVNIVTFGEREALIAAFFRSCLKNNGTPIGYYDILIAAAAKAGNHIMVTSNLREFSRIENLEIENWRKF